MNTPGPLARPDRSRPRRNITALSYSSNMKFGFQKSFLGCFNHLDNLNNKAERERESDNDDEEREEGEEMSTHDRTLLSAHTRTLGGTNE